MSSEISSEGLAKEARRCLETLRASAPLINHITNFVVMNDTANITIAAGGRPIMGHALEEAEALTVLSRALVINAGNVTFSDWNETMVRSALAANRVDIPVVLDPVGYGATESRTRMTDRLLREARVDIVRGNRGEIGAMSGLGGSVSGVDAVGEQADPVEAACTLARRLGAVVAVGGEKDVVSDGRTTFEIGAGHRFLTALTGTGCMATSVIAAYVGAGGARLESTAFALAHYRLAARDAGASEAGRRGPGSFRSSLLDAMYNLQPEDLERRLPECLEGSTREADHARP